MNQLILNVRYILFSSYCICEIERNKRSVFTSSVIHSPMSDIKGIE